MRKRILVFMGLCLGMLCLGAQDSLLSDLLLAHRKATGHQELPKLYGIQAKGTFSLGPAVIPIVISWHQGRMRMEYDYGENRTAISVYTPENSWKTTPWAPNKVESLEGRELTELQEMAQVSGLLCNLDVLGYEASLPEPPQENTFLVDPRNGDTYRVVLDAKTRLIDRVERDKFIAGKYQTITTLYKDYKQHEGLWLAGLMEQQIGGKTVLSWKIDEVRTKLKMDVKLFEKP